MQSVRGSSGAVFAKAGLIMFPKNPPVVSKKLRDSAKGQECTVRLVGVCNWDPATTVLAHLRIPGTGIGLKESDFHAAYCCSECHNHIDGRVKRIFPIEYLKIAFFEGMVRTQGIMVQKGLIKVL